MDYGWAYGKNGGELFFHRKCKGQVTQSNKKDVELYLLRKEARLKAIGFALNGAFASSHPNTSKPSAFFWNIARAHGKIPSGSPLWTKVKKSNQIVE